MNTTDQSQWAPPQTAYERAREIERQQVIAEYQRGPKWGVNSAAWPDQSRQSHAGLRFISMTVIVFGWLIFVGGIIGGIATAVQTDYVGYYGNDKSYPYVGAGVAIGIGATFYASIMLLFGYWAHAWARSKAS